MGVVSILNVIRKSMLNFYVHHDTIFIMIQKYQLQRLDKVLSKYSKHSIRLKINMKNKVNIYNRSRKKLNT